MYVMGQPSMGTLVRKNWLLLMDIFNVLSSKNCFFGGISKIGHAII